MVQRERPPRRRGPLDITKDPPDDRAAPRFERGGFLLYLDHATTPVFPAGPARRHGPDPVFRGPLRAGARLRPREIHDRITTVTEQILEAPSPRLVLLRGKLYRRHSAWESAAQDYDAAAALLGSSLAAAEQILLPRNSTWNYEATGTDLGTSWKETSYDDDL